MKNDLENNNSSGAFSGSARRVALAVVVRSGQWLLDRRAPGRQFAGLWEFPGGGIDPGETPQQAAERECHEETGVEVRAQRVLAPVRYPASEPALLLYPVLCRYVNGTPAARDPAVAEARWVDDAALRLLAMPPANERILAVLPPLTDWD